MIRGPRQYTLSKWAVISCLYVLWLYPRTLVLWFLLVPGFCILKCQRKFTLGWWESLSLPPGQHRGCRCLLASLPAAAPYAPAVGRTYSGMGQPCTGNPVIPVEISEWCSSSCFFIYLFLIVLSSSKSFFFSPALLLGFLLVLYQVLPFKLQFKTKNTQRGPFATRGMEGHIASGLGNGAGIGKEKIMYSLISPDTKVDSWLLNTTRNEGPSHRHLS